MGTTVLEKIVSKGLHVTFALGSVGSRGMGKVEKGCTGGFSTTLENARALLHRCLLSVVAVSSRLGSVGVR